MASKSNVQRRRRKVSVLYLRGFTQVEIKDKLGVSQATVSYDLKAIQEEWRAQTTIDLDEHKAAELARLDELERQYWRGWLRSLQDAQESSEKAEGIVTKDNQRKDFQITRSKKTKGQAGDPRFLDGIQGIVDKRCKILSLYADANINVNVTEKLTMDERKRRLENFFKFNQN